MSATASASSSDRSHRQVWRFVLLIHRYLGIGIGLLVLLWCSSGIIMMYVQYPELTRAEQLAGLDPLLISDDCCRSPERIQDAALAVAVFSVEAGVDGLLMRLVLTDDARLVLDLQTGRLFDHWAAADLDAFGRRYATNHELSAPMDSIPVDRDQWTVHARFNTHRPLEKFTNLDGEEWYVSSLTGEVVQGTTFYERFWNWPGAVTHWLYPTALRQHTGVWAQVVIWLTIISLFLTVTGIAIGIKHYRWRGDRRRSPYSGWSLWHHYAGLLFGLMTLIWLASGLLSMNPWGMLEGRSIAAERQVLNGRTQTLGEAAAVLRSVINHVPADTVRLASAPWLGEQYFVAWSAAGVPTRLSGDGPVEPLSAADVHEAVVRLNIGANSIDRLEGGDNYYFGHHDDMDLPVFRILTSESERFYLSVASGVLVAHYDESRLWYRWLFEGLHRGDFAPILRTRPLWDLIMLLMLGGVAVGVATGVYLGWRRVGPG